MQRDDDLQPWLRGRDEASLAQLAVIQRGVDPQIQAHYKHSCSKVKQYFKEGRALRTERRSTTPPQPAHALPPP